MNTKSPIASLFFFIKKKDGMLQPVMDYCIINGMMVKNKYPLLLIQDLIDHIHQAKYFTKYDV